MRSIYQAGAVLLLSLPLLLVAILHRKLEGLALYTEEEVLNANVLHPLFNSEEHFAKDYWQPSMRQRDRLAALSLATHGAAIALKRIGINAFLESGGLIGWLRHDGGQLPWETDGDVGILTVECEAVKATKAGLQSVIDAEFEVLKFACACVEDCAGDNKRMVGRITHRATGVCIDIFAYATVRAPRPWQKGPYFASTGEWFERIDDHADYTFPREALLPLQNGTFAGLPMMIPRDPWEFLSWEYGRCLGVHVWPWRLLLYTPVSTFVLVLIVAKGGAAAFSSPLLAAILIAQVALVLSVLKGGLALLVLVVSCLCELGALLLWPGLWGTPRAKLWHRRAALVILAVLLFELRGCFWQLLCQVDDFYIRPRRPKSWTLCLLGRCWDF